ncbi:MAG TPA: hypothetical protein VFT56_02170 [Sphingomonas sp.]|nr:hypothetical protein [Sphingomonas sp.]
MSRDDESTPHRRSKRLGVVVALLLIIVIVIFVGYNIFYAVRY